MTQELFISTIAALRDQSDIDTEKAKKLSAIYGSDINPNDNRILINNVLAHLQSRFSEDALAAIDFFCFQQDFGRASNKPIKELWDELVMMYEVIDPLNG